MRTILITQGFALMGIAVCMVFPALVEIFSQGQDYPVFLLSAFLCLFVGSGLVLTNQSHKYYLKVKEAYLMTTLMWIVIPFFASMPFYFTSSTYHLSLTDAMFESVSGLTTTGSTVYVGLDNAPKGILLWRSMLQWIGGIGIVAFSIVVFPYLKIGGMQLFQAESSDRSDKILPRIQQVARAILVIYLLLSVLCMICFYLGGMTAFDAINHAMATISTGGFSTYDSSFGHFQEPVLHWLAVLFMILGGSPLLLFYFYLVGKKPSAPLLSQALTFWIALTVVILVLSIWVYYTTSLSFFDASTQVAFNITSVVTTTGFASTDYTLWAGGVVVCLYFLTIAGGCTGSTAGGIKIFRFQVMFKMVALYTKRLVFANGVFHATLGKKTLTEDVMQSVVVFLALFILVFVIITLGLTMTGLDLITSLTGTATALSNVGPGLGNIIGPVGNFATLSDPAKWLLTAAMLIGRLEVITVVVLFTRSYWEDFSLLDK